jgi:hypothetical protein
MIRKEIKGENGEELVFVIPDTTVNHATHIHISTLDDGKAFILESACIIPVIFNKQPDKDPKNVNGEFKINIDEIPPFSRILITKETLEGLAKTIKSLGISV